ncbi:glycerophosphodiester phosphodiesterase [Bacillus clarus]|uniref:Glycerophosphodiester phosphodiesterase n=1 Tax=Bacillus clarus TaxID=2338372 RepID=A0A090YKX8_9BACI|nr:glycerophosphodiester phosphodiesterase [Bacillus clarus]KFM99074.1 glycerophosphoryl diester phosphodiesterase family protein [Bacillus clarus]RFT62429.1 glycerophosphodiester phosphodiesterase [Bacillus clarus]
MKNIFITTTLCIFIGISIFIFQQMNEHKYTKAINQPNYVKNIAHRGASTCAPEHTIAAYKLGQQLKGDYIEIDLQMTKDGHLIAMHDETLNRTTNGTGLVKDHTLEEIKQLDTGSSFNKKNPSLAKEEFKNAKVPTLEEIIEAFGQDAHYYIETKSPDEYPRMEEKLLEILSRYQVNDKVIIQSFSQESLKKIHILNSAIPLVQLLTYKKTVRLTEAELVSYSKYCIGLGMNYKYVDAAYVQKIKQYGLEVHPFTVDKEEDMKKLIEWGVDGMFTNYPDRLHSILSLK